jgi:hypothetical protein
MDEPVHPARSVAVDTATVDRRERVSPVPRPRPIDAAVAPDEVDLTALTRRLVERLDDLLDPRSEEDRDAAEAEERERAVSVWTSALARTGPDDRLAARRDALGTTVLRTRAGDRGQVADGVDTSDRADLDGTDQADPDDALEAAPQGTSAPPAVSGGATDDPPEPADVADPTEPADVAGAIDPHAATTVVPDVDVVDAKLQTVRRRLEGRRAVGSRPAPDRTRRGLPRRFASWVRHLLLGAGIVVLGALISVAIL